MWPFKPLKHELITIIIQPNTLVCCWIKKSKQRAAPFELLAYSKHFLQSGQLLELIPFNHTNIKKYVTSFLKKYAAHHAFVSLALEGLSPSFYESYLLLPHAHATLKQVIPHKNPHWMWNLHYLYPHEHGHMFYLYGMPHPILLQYKILLNSLTVIPVSITSGNIALFNMYRFIQGSTFRKAQLAQNMMQHNNDIENYFTKDILHRILYNATKKSIIFEQEYPYLMRACGLFIKEMYET